MSEKPILFNTEMVNAIMEGRKTVTRRIIKNVNDKDFIGFVTCSTSRSNEGKAGFGKGSFEDICNANIDEYVRPPYKAGDILYVRETWKKYTKRIGKSESCRIAEFYGYKADEDKSGNPSEFYEGNWKPSIHMPKEAARIFLRVTNVRVERLQQIEHEDVLKEGLKASYDGWVSEWKNLWDSTIKKFYWYKYGFDANPWVWVIEFERIEKGNENDEE
ncbi:MAG: hypothetical protein KH415_09550 [Clostridium sp.]|nr:hypothetical protein [Clostridium sp.]